MKLTHDVLSLIITYGAFVIPIWELIFNKQNKGLKRINKLGWCALVFGLICVSDGCLNNSIKENEKTQSDTTLARKERSDDLIKHQLQYSLDSSNRMVNNIDSILRVVYKLSIEKTKTGNIIIVQKYTAPPNYITCPIQVETAENPNNAVQSLCNGDKIRLQYSVNKDGTLTIPYMKGKMYAGSFLLNNDAGYEVSFDKSTGTFDVSKNGGFGNGRRISFSANIPQKEPELLTLLIIMGENGANLSADGKTVSHPYLRKPINEISANGQSYITGVEGGAFTQDVKKGTITAIGGYGWYKGEKIILKR